MFVHLFIFYWKMSYQLNRDQLLSQQFPQQQSDSQRSYQQVYNDNKQQFFHNIREHGGVVAKVKVQLSSRKEVHKTTVFTFYRLQQISGQWMTRLLKDQLKKQNCYENQSTNLQRDDIELNSQLNVFYEHAVCIKIEFEIQQRGHPQWYYDHISDINLNFFSTDFLLQAARLIKIFTYSPKRKRSIKIIFQEFQKLVQRYCHLIKAMAQAMREHDEFKEGFRLQIEVFEQYFANWQIFLEIIQPIIQITRYKQPYFQVTESNELKSFKALGYFLLMLYKEKETKGKILIKQGQIRKVSQNFYFLQKCQKQEENSRKHSLFQIFQSFVDQNLKMILRNEEIQVFQFLKVYNQLEQDQSKLNNSKETSELIKAINSFLLRFYKYFIHLPLRILFNCHNQEANHYIETHFNLNQHIRYHLLISAVIGCIKVMTETALSTTLGSFLVKKYEITLQKLLHDFKRLNKYKLYKLKNADLERFNCSLKQLKLEAKKLKGNDKFLYYAASIAESAKIFDRIAIQKKPASQKTGLSFRYNSP